MAAFQRGDRVRLKHSGRTTAREARRIHTVAEAEPGEDATSAVLIDWSHIPGYRSFVDRGSLVHAEARRG